MGVGVVVVRGGQEGEKLTLGGFAAATLPYSLSKETIEKDLTSEAPTWILSCYGPGRDAPEQLFGGYPREQSTDEIRLHFEKAAQAGKQQEAVRLPKQRESLPTALDIPAVKGGSTLCFAQKS